MKAMFLNGYCMSRRLLKPFRLFSKPCMHGFRQLQVIFIDSPKCRQSFLKALQTLLENIFYLILTLTLY